MKIAIDISPISKNSTSAHKVRGVGSYINLLVNNLKSIDKANEYSFVENGKFPSNADIIHYPYFDPFFLTLPSAFKKETIVTVHDLTPIVFSENFPVGIKGKIKWHLQKRRLKKANYIVADSISSGDDIHKIVGIDKSKIKVVYLAADEKFREINDKEKLTNIIKKYNLPEQFVLYVGDATWNKNLPRLIEAIKKTNYTLVLVGKIWGSELANVPENAWNDDLRKVLKKMENDSQFIKLGFLPDEDLAMVYNTATTLIMPSIYEGFGLPVLEAMQSGCSVIASRGGSLPEIGGESVFYVDWKSSDNIGKGIEKIMTDSTMRKELSKKGLEQAKKFSKVSSIKKLIEVYESQKS